jgi:hypothetical protein
MADTTAAAFAAVDHMDIVKVSLAIAKFCVNSRFGKTEQIFLVAAKTGIIDAFLIGDVDFGWITPPQHTEIVRAMRIMADGALAIFYRAMKEFFSVKIFFDITQRRSAEIVGAMTAEACFYFIERQEPLVFRVVG